jgi:hypothetical protein
MNKRRRRVQRLARKIRRATVPANLDKPHRCPRCHRIPEAARTDGRAIHGKRYTCEGCGVHWIGPPDVIGASP